jgi:hypothetical protein
VRLCTVWAKLHCRGNGPEDASSAIPLIRVWMGLDTRGPESSRHRGVRRHSDTDSHGRDEVLDSQRAEGATLTRRCHPSPSTVHPFCLTFNHRLVAPASYYTLASSLAT